jgi:hypothetical protein
MGGRLPYVPPPKPKPQPTRPSTRGLGRAAIPFIPPKDGGTTNNNGTKKDLVKTSSPTNYVEEVQKTKADFSIEERVAFMALTGTEILEVSRNFNMSSNSLRLNKNTLDSTVVVKAASPIELIKTQNSNTDYIAKSSSTVENTVVAIAPATGTITVTAPAATVSTAPAQPAKTTTNAATVTNTNQVKVEVQKPTEVVTQATTVSFELISFTPLSAKKGDTITVTHKGIPSSGTRKSGFETTPGTPVSLLGRTNSTFTIKIPKTPTTSHKNFVVGKSYKIYVEIGGVRVTTATGVTILPD